MAAANSGDVGMTAWTLQSKQRAAIPTHTPSAMSASLMNSTGFRGWTDVPPVGTHDPYIADQVRPGRRVLTGPTSSPMMEPYGGGKRIVGPWYSEATPAGKRAYPDLVGKVSDDTPKPSGLKRVETRARHEYPALADPNSAVQATTYKPESVKMFDGTNQVRRPLHK